MMQSRDAKDCTNYKWAPALATGVHLTSARPSNVARHETTLSAAARRIEVDEFDHLTAPIIVGRVTRTPLVVNRNRLIGLSGTIIVHGLAGALLIPVTLAPKTVPPDPAGVSVSRAPTAPADELVLINVNNPKKSDEAPAATIVDLRSQLTKLPIPTVIPDRMPVIDLTSVYSNAENSAQSDANPGDAELRARMYGRYTAQISARIERAWEKPRSPANEPKTARSADAIDPDSFVCQVQIRQDDRGNVREVLLLACNGTEAWRHSLVVAINQSSPLPAPPIPTVFKRALTMTFEGRVHRDGALPEVVDLEPRGEPMKP
jgi:TonB C terminal